MFGAQGELFQGGNQGKKDSDFVLLSSMKKTLPNNICKNTFLVKLNDYMQYQKSDINFKNKNHIKSNTQRLKISLI